MARRRHYGRRRSRSGGGKGIMAMGPIVIVIGVIILAAAAYFIMKRMKGKGAMPVGPSLDTVVANQQKAVQQAHAARLTCSSCGGSH